jgi:2-polyprenyl-3-methyl-5-hydroxy-6-metoxy-1,4-benzoquinol methylase
VDTKPPGWSSVYGAAFGDTEVVQVYHLRPPYPDETIAELVRLASGATVLDAGCGTGDLARDSRRTSTGLTLSTCPSRCSRRLVERRW